MKRVKVAFGRAVFVGFLVAMIAGTGVQPVAAAPSWSQIMKTFKPGWDPNSSNVCVRGTISCVEAVVAEMKRRNRPLMETCNHNAVFSLLYLRTTQEYLRTVKANPNFFSNTPFVNHEDALFALYYFRAYDDYHAGRVDQVPAAWRIAFDSARDGSTTGGGDLLLGVSAHINRDLPYVIHAINMPKQPNGYSDHNKVNEILQRVQTKAIEEAARRLDPTIDDTQIEGTRLDDDGFLQIVKNWREHGWRNGEQLSAQPTVAATKIETNARVQAEGIAQSNRADEASRQARDSYCALHHNDP